MNSVLSKKITLENIFSFHGGVHPEQNKNQTAHQGITDAQVPPELVIPLQQHIGAPAKPVVTVGDKVLKGQLIAQANGFVSVPVHAPSSGVISAIEKRPVQHPSGLAGECIVLSCDGLDQWCELKPVENYLALTKETLIQIIRDAGIAGLGGAGFPSAVKLKVKEQQIHTLIVNSVECEPYITADDVLIQAHATEIIKGLEILNHLLESKEILIGIEDNKPEAIEAYKQAINQSELNIIKLAIVPTKYPSGGEKQLIQLLTGKEVPSGGLPADLGIVCQNTGTIFAIYEAVVLGKPLIERITTLTGKALAKPQNYRALIGTPFKFLLNAAEVNWKHLNQLVMGGPMMGFSVDTPDVPLVKTTNCILAAAKGELVDPALEQPCIRCGSCAEVCPANLLPQQLYWYSKAKDLEKTEQYHLADCIECGACSFVCPSNIPLVQYFRFAKGETRNKAIELKKSEQSRERFEARKARLEREEAEKEAKRLAKLEERKQKKSEQDNNDTEATADALEIALQNAKTNAAKATKQWKEAEKALEAARKLQEDVSAHETQVKNLEAVAQAAQEQFKIALANKKNAPLNNTSASANEQNELDKKIDAIREQSSQASLELKNLKKSLLSEKAGNSDTSELEKKVEQSKNQSDQLKAQLRDLLQQQKALSDSIAQTPVENNNTPSQQKLRETTSAQQALNLSNEDDEKNKLKIELAVIKAQAKKLNNALLDCDDNTRQELEVLLADNQKKLNSLIEKMTTLNSKNNTQQEPKA